MSLRNLFLLLLALPSVAAAGVRGQDPEAPPRPQAQLIVVPVTGDIGVRSVYMVQSALREARTSGVAYVVLDIDTPGGEVVASREIEGVIGELSATEVKVLAFVRRKAWSAGAYIALACADLYMAPGSSIGSIVPVAVGPAGIQSIPDEDVRRKLIAALRGDVRAMLARRGRENLGKVAEAMVDPDLELFEAIWEDQAGVQMAGFLDRDEVRELEDKGVKVSARAMPTRPLHLSADEAQRMGLSSGTVTSLEELARDELRLDADAILYRQETWSEEAVAWLDGMKPVLFALGFVLLLVELKTPGFAVPGVLGLLLLALAMFGSYLVGLAEWTEILLFFLGLGLIALEIYLLPGMMVFGVLGLFCVASGLVLSQQSFFLPANAAQESILLGNLTNILLLALVVLIGSIALWKLAPHVPVFNRILQPPPDVAQTGAAVGRRERGDDARARLLGRVGAAGTDLRPVGSMDLDGVRYDVMTRGAFVAKGSGVRVVDVQLNQVIVEPVEGGGPAPPRGEIALTLLILLWLLGLGFVMAEVFFPSAGVLSVLAAVSFVSSIFLAYTHHGAATGHVFLITAAIAVPVALYWGFKLLPNTPFGRALLLGGPDPALVHGAAEQPGLATLINKRGVALCDLRPAGIARIDGERVDVVTRGELLHKDAPVMVLEVEGNRVVVALDEEAARRAEEQESVKE